MLTGLYDLTSVKSELVELPEGAHVRFTEAAHIIPESTNHGIDNPVKVCQTSSLFTTFFPYTYNIGPPVCGGVGGVVDVFIQARGTPSKAEWKQYTSTREYHDSGPVNPYGIRHARTLV